MIQIGFTADREIYIYMRWGRQSIRIHRIKAGHNLIRKVVSNRKSRDITQFEVYGFKPDKRWTEI